MSDVPKPGLKQALRTIVPDSWIRERDTFLRLGPKAGPIYARLRILEALGLASQNTRWLKPSVRSVLFVCYGNIMRSPMAAAMLRQVAGAHMTDLQIDSAGLHAIPGTPAHPRALEAAMELGLPLTAHRAQLLTPEFMSGADIVFAMDYQNMAELLALYPEFRTKIAMLGDYAEGQPRGREIPDPYFGDLETTRQCYGVLQDCVRNLAADLAGHDRERVPAESR